MEHQTPLVSLEISGNEKCGRPSPFLFGFRKTATGQGATRQGPGGRQDTDALGDPFLRVALIARPLALALCHLAPWPTACSRRHRCPWTLSRTPTYRAKTARSKAGGGGSVRREALRRHSPLGRARRPPLGTRRTASSTASGPTLWTLRSLAPLESGVRAKAPSASNAWPRPCLSKPAITASSVTSV